MFSHVNMDDL